MGYAGLVGFKGNAQSIHHTKGPYERCSACDQWSHAALVHNVRHDKLGHSDHFLTIGHADSFWLPFFWGIEPCEYQEWLDLCDDAANTEDLQGPNSPALRLHEKWLRTTPWRWSQGTLEDYIRPRLLEHMANLALRRSESEIVELENAAVRLIWKEVGNARRARDRWIAASCNLAENRGWREKLRNMFRGNSVDLQRLNITSGATNAESARETEDLIRSLNPIRAVSRVIMSSFR
jgi:hypothetical protein